MTEKELVEYIQNRLDEAIDRIQQTIDKNTTCEFKTKCLYEYLIMQCNNTKSFITIAIMKDWNKEEFSRIYYLTYNSILSIDLLIGRENDCFERYDYEELDGLLTICLQAILGQLFTMK